MREKSFNTSLDKCSALKCFQSAWTCRINKKKTIYDKYSILLIKASGELSKHLIKSVCSNNLAAQDQTHPLLLQWRTSWCSLPFVLVQVHPLIPFSLSFLLRSPGGLMFLRTMADPSWSPPHYTTIIVSVLILLPLIAFCMLYLQTYYTSVHLSLITSRSAIFCQNSIDFHLSWDISRSFHLEASTNHTAHSMWKGFTKQVSVCSVCASLFQ